MTILRAMALCVLVIGPSALPEPPTAAHPRFPPRVAEDIPRQALVLEQEFNAEGYGQLGRNVALSADTALLGKEREVYVYSRTGGVWTRTQVIRHDTSLEMFGDAVAVDGNTAVVGAPANTANASRGSVYVYSRDQAGFWVELQRIVPSDDPLPVFGKALALAGDTLMVLGGVSGGIESAYVYVFTRNAGQWSERQKLLLGSGVINGGDVAIEAGTAVIGVPQQEVAGREYQGAAYVLTRAADGTWTQRQTLFGPNGQAGDFFGEYVALNGDRILATALRDATRPSSVYVFTRAVDGIWRLEAELTDPESTASDLHTDFGRDVAVQGDKALVGAPGHIVADGRMGAAYLFSRGSDGTWTVQQRLIPHYS